MATVTTGYTFVNNETVTPAKLNSLAGGASVSAIVNADIDASAAIADTKLATISTASKVSNSATTATSANTASAIVARDASGNFSAGTITATTVTGSGNSSFGGNVGIGTSTPSSKLTVFGGQINLINSGDSVSSITTTAGNVARLVLNNQSNNGRNWSISAWGSGGDGALYISDDTAAANRLSIASDGKINTQGNPITNCPTTAKAWVNFNGAFTNYTAQSYTRSGTTVTVTTTSHGLSTGNKIYVPTATDTGVIGFYNVTVINPNSFSFQTSATGANGTLTWYMQFRSSYNVSSITKLGTGDYTVNFATPMADANYSVSANSCSTINDAYLSSVILADDTTARSTSGFRLTTAKVSAGTNRTNTDYSVINAIVFAN